MTTPDNEENMRPYEHQTVVCGPVDLDGHPTPENRYYAAMTRVHVHVALQRPFKMGEGAAITDMLPICYLITQDTQALQAVIHMRNHGLNPDYAAMTAEIVITEATGLAPKITKVTAKTPAPQDVALYTVFKQRILDQHLWEAASCIEGLCCSTGFETADGEVVATSHRTARILSDAATAGCTITSTDPGTDHATAITLHITDATGTRVDVSINTGTGDIGDITVHLPESSEKRTYTFLNTIGPDTIINTAFTDPGALPREGVIAR